MLHRRHFLYNNRMTETTDPRQTLSYIRDLIMSHGLSPKNKMGQNFLVDLNLVDLIIATAELDREDSILEVGTGTGGLTARLSDHAGAVLSVELDTDFHRMASHLLRKRTNIQLIHADILAGKNELNPGVVAAWDQLSATHRCARRKLVANLPYVVATPVIGNLLISDIALERMVVMVQWELAERMIAEVGTKEYSSLAVLIQSVADVQIVRRLAPTVFWPKPQVDSAIVCIRPNPTKRAPDTECPSIPRVLAQFIHASSQKSSTGSGGLADRTQGQKGSGCEARRTGNRRNSSSGDFRSGNTSAIM